MSRCPFRCKTTYKYDGFGNRIQKIEEFGECYGGTCPAHFFTETDDGKQIDGCELCSGPVQEEEL